MKPRLMVLLVSLALVAAWAGKMLAPLSWSDGHL
jgi:hypothetical protein